MNYEARLNTLKERRSVSDNIRKEYILDEAGIAPGLESFYGIKESPEIRYAIGAMQPVTARYTEISKEEGSRVATTLLGALKAIGTNASYYLQGSVPLDIHIKGVSDVDVLIFHPYFTTQGPVAAHKNYTTINDGKSMLDRIRELRLDSERILKDKYPAATVDNTRPKAINMEGGSLRREIDIVPAHWYDTLAYQYSDCLSDREVKIYDKKNHVTIGNSPFKHMSVINDRDSSYNGNLKKVCRLLKNLKADAEQSVMATLKPLSSYDIAGLAYHMSHKLRIPMYYELGLVSNTREFLLEVLSNDCAIGETLITPDGSRKILDSKVKKDAAIALTHELCKLHDDIAISLSPSNKEHGSMILKSKAVIFN